MKNLKLGIPIALCLVGMLLVTDAMAATKVYHPTLDEYTWYYARFGWPDALRSEAAYENIFDLLAGDAPRPYNICIMHSLFSIPSYFNTFVRNGWEARHFLESRATLAAGRPLTQAYLESLDCDVAVFSDIWQGDPSWYYGSWGYSRAEVQELESWADSNDGGVLLTSGSFSGHSTIPSRNQSNYDSFHEFMGLEATNAAVCDPPNGLCPCTFPWGYPDPVLNSQCPGWYPRYARGQRPYFTVDDPSHELATTPNAIPSPWEPYYWYTSTQWMKVTEAIQVMNLAHWNNPPEPDALITAVSGKGLPVEVTLEFRDGPFKGHPIAMWVTVTHIGEEPAEDNINVSMTGLDLSESIVNDVGGIRAEPDVANDEYYTFVFNDTNNDGNLDSGESMTWSFVAIMPWGPPDATLSLNAKFCEDEPVDARCKGGSAKITTDSCKHNIADEPWDLLSEYRHYQKALVFTRTGWRNGDPRFEQALELIRQNTDQAFKDGHTLISNTSPGPGNYNLELIHENLNEGNCQFGVTGDWLKDNGW